MPIFFYEGRDSDKKIKKGKRVVESEEILSEQLMKEGITPISIVPFMENKKNWRDYFKHFFEKKMSLDDLGIFCRQMYTLCKTGVPLSNAIKHLADGTSNASLAHALYNMVEHLEAGEDMASSMENYPNVFPKIITTMVRVGQNSGRLPEAFLRCNQYLEIESSTLKDLKTALRYPFFVIFAMVAAIVIINIFVMPAFTKMFESSNMPLPLPTKILITTSDFFINHWLFMIVAVSLIVGSIYYYLHTEKGRFNWHRTLLKIPVLGKMIKGTILLRFSQTFAMTIESGITIIDGLDLVSQSIGNEYARSRIIRMREAIEHGNNLTQAAVMSELFTSLELQMLAVSEETGELSAMLEQIAIFYKREVEYDLKRLSSLIEPLLIMILAGMVLILALAIYLPIWNMAELARGG